MDFKLTKEQQLIILGLIASIVVGLVVTAYQHYFTEPAGKIEIEEPRGNSFEPAQTGIIVHVSGAVRREGVYRLKQGDRLLDALEMAGGVLPVAELSGLNLAEPLKDGVRIGVPIKRRAIERISGNQEIGISGTSSRKVNLNSADEKTLDSLPGIGPSTAKAMVEYRRTNGPFAKIEQIMEIPRFGKSKFERIKDRITI